MSTVKLLINEHKRSPFGYRLKEAFQGAPNKEIAKRLGISNSAVTTYMLGRIPPAEMLIEISRLTSFSIHWLITGEGEKLVNPIKEKAHTILVTNDKGGATRTTSAVTLAVEFARRGYRTLFIDDSSTNGTTMLFPKLFPMEKLIKQHLNCRAGMPLSEAKMIFRTPVEDLDLCSFEEELWPILTKNNVETVQISPGNVNEEYRFIVIDTLSHINPFSRINLFTAPMLSSAHLLIPIPLTSMGAGGLKFTLKYLKEARQSSDKIRLLGGFFTLVKPNRNKDFTQKNRDELSALIPGKLLQTVIRDRDEIDNSGHLGAVQYSAPKSVGAKDYSALTDEILSILENRR